ATVEANHLEDDRNQPHSSAEQRERQRSDQQAVLPLEEWAHRARHAGAAHGYGGLLLVVHELGLFSGASLSWGFADFWSRCGCVQRQQRRAIVTLRRPAARAIAPILRGSSDIGRISERGGSEH